ncbi:DUF992 domain-containing protein [Xanthobacter autotrophicus]|uniref:DUF992 domain-containing protein n=1 Tax=Xanthobacter TaxID=279 RepID=UPI0024AC5514|nr:DUF992 domain-containing protein [Xanthobacter autotrophicus]MDI4665104.1 DUF992 domain-containing protein [Xanthobacter autotrophicus]
MRASFAAVSAIALAALPATAQTMPPAPSAPKVQSGMLVCKVAPSIGFILGSLREMGCEFRDTSVQPYVVKSRYKGTIARFGIDIGALASDTLAWAVFAPSVQVAPSDIAGSYVGVSVDAAWTIGGGTNILLGGSSNQIALQTVSVEGMVGADIAAGVADLTLVLLPN